MGVILTVTRGCGLRCQQPATCAAWERLKGENGSMVQRAERESEAWIQSSIVCLFCLYSSKYTLCWSSQKKRDLIEMQKRPTIDSGSRYESSKKTLSAIPCAADAHRPYSTIVFFLKKIAPR
jgi:hypothetical protein